MRPVTRAGRWSWSRCFGTAGTCGWTPGRGTDCRWPAGRSCWPPTRAGQQPLAVALAETCQVYRTEGRRIRLEADCPGSKVEPLAVLDTADPNQFAVFGADGAIRLYQMPHR